jgi:thiol:disulfide interchange protein DsbA
MVLRLLSVFCGLCLAFAAYAQGTPVEGVDYIELKPPQPVESSDRVEVLEFFWYRCPHCYALEPELEAWAKRLPRDVQFRRSPGILNDDWAIDARIFFTLEAIGELERLHRPLFDAIHQQGGVRLHGDAFAKWTAEWLAKQKVDMAKYDAAFRSFTVESKLRRATQMGRAFRLDGVPALAVQGRYLVVASTSRKAMLATADFLIGETRKQLAKAKP